MSKQSRRIIKTAVLVIIVPVIWIWGESDFFFGYSIRLIAVLAFLGGFALLLLEMWLRESLRKDKKDSSGPPVV